MPMTRQQLRQQAAVARYRAGKQKPPTRAQAQALLAPIRKAFAEIKTGEVDAYRGYAITRIKPTDEDFARIDYCINGFVALIDRLLPDLDTGPMKRVSAKLANGVLLEMADLEACDAVLNATEDRLLTKTRAELIDAANTEMTVIELERLGLKEAA